MKTINKGMKLSIWILSVALVLSTIAAYYSIMGLVTMFSAAALPIVVMATAMEISKVSVTVWLHRYWSECRVLMKCYLVPAVGVLMLITSMGVFGLLSRAHSGQAAENGDIAARLEIVDERIRTERENIEASRASLAQLNAGVDQTLARSTTEGGAGRAVQIRKSQARERAGLQDAIKKSSDKIAALTEERAPIAVQLRHAEAEVGPIKYVAAMIYGDNPDVTLLERAVRWVIVLLVSVFDPLAIFMVLAAVESLKWERARSNRVSLSQADTVVNEEDEENVEIAAIDPVLGIDPDDYTMLDTRVERAEDRIDTIIESLQQIVADAVPSEPPISPAEEAELAAAWSRLNPEAAQGEHRSLHEIGIEQELPWCEPEFVERYRRGEFK